jgi:rare lipoprotein A
MNFCKHHIGAMICIGIAFFFIGCTSTPRFAERGGRSQEQPSPKERESVSSTQPERSPSDKPLLTLEGIASYYADDFHGKQTSNGETFDMNSLTAAHRTFPFGTKIRVTNLENAKTVIVRVNDRGPFKEGRMIDLSRGAAQALDLVRTGTARVRLEVLEWGKGN